jgi:hypothetical protein
LDYSDYRNQRGWEELIFPASFFETQGPESMIISRDLFESSMAFYIYAGKLPLYTAKVHLITVIIE